MHSGNFVYLSFNKNLPQVNPTTDILLCASKNDSVVTFNLPVGQRHIFASQYKLYLPTEQQLLNEVNKELESFEGKGDNDAT